MPEPRTSQRLAITFGHRGPTGRGLRRLAGHDGPGRPSGAETWEPEHIPAFVWQGLTTTFDVTASTTGVGALALAGLVLWLLRHRGELRGRLAATAAYAVGAVVF
ncbi:MAG: hypothetical protein M3N32_04555, partial [Actinomycetota bacterium]|nr:hypothetical protein [Actinomycetota bacterium]